MSRKNWKLLLGLLVASLLIGALLIVAISPRLTEPFVIATQPAMEGTVTPLPDGEETPEEAEPTEPLSGGLPPYGVGGGSPIGTPTVKADQPPGESLDKLTEQALQKLTKGTVVYNNPDSMRVGEPEQIQALLVRSTSPEIVEVLEKVVVESAGGTPLSETIRMSQLMQVRLVPQDPRDFRIVPLHTEEVQPVGPDDATSWSWVVTPLRSGERRVLYLKATAMIEIPGEPLRSKDLPTQTIAIPVDVNPTYSVQIFLMRYGWVLAVLLLAGLGAVALRKGYLARFFKPGEPSKEIPVPHDYAQLEIRILKREPEGYPVEMTCGGRQFPRGYIRADILDWHPTLSSCEDGERLFEAFVRDDRLKVVWAEIRGQSPRRRIRLRIDASAPELHAIPWEIMRDTSVAANAEALAADTDTPFSRYLAGQWDPLGPVAERPIKVLAAIANPVDLSDYGLMALDVEREQALIEEALSGAALGQVVLSFMPQPLTLAALEAELRHGYHILHFVGHGRYNSREEAAALFMADPDNRVAIVRESAFADMLLRQDQCLRLAFLASCQTATRSPAEAFRGFAPALIAAGVPTVLAMQDLVPIVSARAFMHTFYRQLFSHGWVDLASNEARSALMSAKLSGSSVPVLFSRLPDNRVLDERAVLGEPGALADIGTA